MVQLLATQARHGSEDILKNMSRGGHFLASVVVALYRQPLAICGQVRPDLCKPGV